MVCVHLYNIINRIAKHMRNGISHFGFNIPAKVQTFPGINIPSDALALGPMTKTRQ